MSKCTDCYQCETKLNKIAIGLNKKLLDINSKRFYCLDCLAAYLEVTVDELLAKVEELKEQGCKQF